MALPVILFNSSTGSDTAASGAGPSTALSGAAGASTGAHTSGSASTTIQLPAGTDLSGVATDGSHVLFLNISTAGTKNFSKITGKNDGADTVTVADSFTISSGASAVAWAIGGKRLTLSNTNSKKLFENNSSSGDIMPGWIIELESGYTETLSATFNCRRAGDFTDGIITFRGASGGTRPILTFSNNSDCIVLINSGWLLKFMELKNTAILKTASIAIKGSAPNARIEDIKVNTRFWKAVSVDSNSCLITTACELTDTASDAFTSSGTAVFINNYVYSNGGIGVNLTGTGLNSLIQYNIIVGNTGDGINISTTGTSVVGGGHKIINNTIDSNTGDGLEVSSAATQISAYTNMLITNNIFSNNGGYGIRFSGSSVTAASLECRFTKLFNNNFYNNTSGKYLPTDIVSTNENTSNPSFPGSGDYTPASALGAIGFPDYSIGGVTKGYFDIGAVQRVEPI